MNGGEDTNLGPSGEVGEWLSKIEAARNDDGMAKYEERCHQVRRKYRYEESALVRTRRYQMLWSNIQTMQSAIYAKPPHAVVSRRFRDPDPVARVATEILERAINFTFEAADFDTEFKMVRDDFLLYARGVARIYYEPEYESEDDEAEDITDARDIVAGEGLGREIGANEAAGKAPSDAGAGITDLYRDTGADKSVGAGSGGHDRGGDRGAAADREQRLKFENVRIRFVQRADFRHQPARVWAECQWIAFRAFLTRPEVSKRFGAKAGKEIALDADPVGSDEDWGRDGHATVNSATPKAAIWEIWDKAENRVLWVSPGYDEVLDEGPPYLDLDGFYPCPRPAYGTLTPDSLVPVPDFVFYQDQAAEIDQLTARIAGLSDMLKFVGFYPAGPQGEGSPEIEKACTPGFENKLIAVPGNFSAFLEGSKTGVPLVSLPTDQTAQTLQACIELRKQLIEDVYQIIGISDIMRGATDPQETEGAQQLKAQYGGTRVRDRQTEIARFCRDIARLVGQVIAQYCSPETIMEMTNVVLPTRAQQMFAQLAARQMAAQRMMQPMNPPGPGQAQGLGAPNPAPPQFGPRVAPGLGAPPVGLPAGPRPLAPIGAPP